MHSVTHGSTDNEFYQRISSSTTPRPGFLGGRSTLTMAADVSHGAVFHSCAKLMSMKRKRRAIPLIFGGLMTMIIGRRVVPSYIHICDRPTISVEIVISTNNLFIQLVQMGFLMEWFMYLMINIHKLYKYLSC